MSKLTSVHHTSEFHHVKSSRCLIRAMLGRPPEAWTSDHIKIQTQRGKVIQNQMCSNYKKILLNFYAIFKRKLPIFHRYSVSLLSCVQILLCKSLQCTFIFYFLNCTSCFSEGNNEAIQKNHSIKVSWPCCFYQVTL